MMYLGNVYFLSLICSASSFSQYSTKQFGLTRLQSTPDDGDDSYLFGAQVPGMPDKVPLPSPIDEDNPSGGQMFKKLMERAKSGPNRPKATFANSEPPQPQTPPPQPQYQQQQPPPPPPPQPQGMDPYSTYQAQLQAWQQQMTAYAQISVSDPEAAAQMTMPPPPQMQATPMPVQQQPPQPPPVSQTPKDPNNPKDVSQYLIQGDGRNAQAYEVNNSADVYFAQLKRDSKVRIDARKAGDSATANAPFEDEGVQALKGLLSDELVQSRRENMERSGGEFETSRDEMLMPQHFEADEDDVDKTFTGVSYKERLMQAKKNNAQAKEPASATPPPATATTAPSDFVPKVQPITFASPSTDASPSTPPPADEATKATNNAVETSESKPNFALPMTDESEMEPIAAPSMEDSEENRRSVRTLMGLLLKHRGGPGFGHGRLNEVEGKKLEDGAAEVMALLNQELGGETSLSTDVDATGTAIDTTESPLSGTVACVETVLSMYKNADVSTKDELVMPLRDAMLSAVNTINKVVAEDELKQQQPPPAPQPEAIHATSLGSDYAYPVPEQTKEEEMKDMQEIVDVIATSSSDQQTINENRARLQKAYDTLKAVAGGEKFGLRNVNTEEINKARQVVVDMKEILMDELES